MPDPQIQGVRDIIVGPIGIVIADALLGEATPAMATAVGQSAAKRILLPVSHCDTVVAGVGSALSVGELLKSAVEELLALDGAAP